MILKAILSTTVVLFSVIDIVGSLPVIINLKKQGMRIHPGIATLTAGGVMLAFLFFGASILSLFGIEISSFALAGALVIFLIGLEMTLGIRFFRDTGEQGGSGSVVPIAFPLIAGAGTLTTIITLKAKFTTLSVLAGIGINLIIVFLVLKSSGWMARKMSEQTSNTLRKIFGILLIAIAIQMFKSHQNNFL